MIKAKLGNRNTVYKMYIRAEKGERAYYDYQVFFSYL